MKLPLWEEGTELLHSARHELGIVHHANLVCVQCSSDGLCLSRRPEVTLGVKEGMQVALVARTLDAL